MTIAPVGIREFRANLAEYAMQSTPVAVTRHGHTVGFFFPVKPDLSAEVAAFKEAGAKLDKLIEDEDLEDILAEFDALRKSARR